ncbi:hypothetical protein AHAS_Ahas06G0135000 [Arachis hypogaea]
MSKDAGEASARRIETEHIVEPAQISSEDKDYDPEADEVESWDDHAVGLLSGILGSLGADFQRFPINEESWKTMDNALKEHAYDTIKKKCRHNALNRSKQLYTSVMKTEPDQMVQSSYPGSTPPAAATAFVITELFSLAKGCRRTGSDGQRVRSKSLAVDPLLLHAVASVLACRSSLLSSTLLYFVIVVVDLHIEELSV